MKLFFVLLLLDTDISLRLLTISYFRVLINELTNYFGILKSNTFPKSYLNRAGHLCGIAPVAISCQALLKTINWKNWGTCLLRIAKLPGHSVAMVVWQDWPCLWQCLCAKAGTKFLLR